MNAQDLADLLTGREKHYEITEDEQKEAARSGLVVMFGYSYRLVEIAGAIDTTVSVMNRHVVDVTFSALGKHITDWEDQIACDPSEEACARWFKLRDAGTKTVTVHKQHTNPNAPMWTFETDIPHETFEVFETDENGNNPRVFCRGIVFATHDMGMPKPSADMLAAQLEAAVTEVDRLLTEQRLMVQQLREAQKIVDERDEAPGREPVPVYVAESMLASEGADL